LDPAAFTQLPSAAGFQARGSRLCFLRGVPAAWTLGQYANSLVSIIVLKQSELEHFPESAWLNGALVEASGHSDGTGYSLSLTIRPLHLIEVLAEEEIAEEAAPA